MADKMQETMDKLRDEMAAQAKHQGIQQIGEYLTGRLASEPGLAGKLGAKGKTLEGAFKAIYDYASKNRSGSYAYVAPEQAYELVNGYYGIGAADAPKAQAHAEAPQRDELDLDDLLGGL